MECEMCGGTDFLKESGFFYCKECQTQSQEVREHVFQEEISNLNLKSTRKIQKNPKVVNLEHKITSWECYNIIMRSLTQQLINLGADENLKSVVKCLWMRYLEKLEVLNLHCDAKPKLPLVNSKIDVDILYGRIKKKRKRKKSTSDESTLANTSLKRERSKRKRALVQSQYEELSQKSIVESSTLDKETLTSLKSNSEKSDKEERCTVSFNRYGIKELRKKMSMRHYRKHKIDTTRTLKCHKLTYAACSENYKHGVEFLSPIKLYCVLYLGLLINKDKIQLGDLFRFINEQHLSFNNYRQLFPDDYLNKFLNIQNNNKNKLFTNKKFRMMAAKLAKFLNVTRFIEVPNMVELCQRYCKEMNLPDEIFLVVRNLLSKTSPKLNLTKSSTIVPNYEGRAMSLILFTLKLLFGLDGVTEQRLSEYSQLISSRNIDSVMFDIKEWMEYIAYRKLFISEHHFPSNYSNNDEVDSDLFLQYIKSQEIEFDENIKLSKEMRNYKEVLTKIKDLQNDYITRIEFPASLTPFLSYSEVLLNSTGHLCLKNMMKRNFKNNSVDFLLRPNEYLNLLGKRIKVKHGGANDNWAIEDMKTYRSINKISRKNFNLYPVKITESGDEKYLDLPISAPKSPDQKYDPEYIQLLYDERRRSIFQKNTNYINKVSKEVDIKGNGPNENKSVPYETHFNPFERYWLYFQMNIDLLNKPAFESFFDKYPGNFKLIFNECSRIIEQSNQELYQEFQLTELFLVFSADYFKGNDISKSRKWLSSDNLSYYVRQAKENW